MKFRLLLLTVPLWLLSGCCPGTCQSQLTVELAEGPTEFTLVVTTPADTFTVTCPTSVDDPVVDGSCHGDAAIFAVWGVDWYGPITYELDGVLVQPVSTESSVQSVCGVICRFVTVAL